MSDFTDKNLFDAVVNTVSDGISVIDKDLKILFQNNANQRVYGNRLGETCYQAYRGRSEVCQDCLVLQVLEDGKIRRSIRDITLPNGDVLWLEIQSGPYRDPDGTIIGAVEVVRDITEQMRLTERYATLRREMEQQFGFSNIVSQSKKMKSIFKLIQRVAATSSTVMISGESGTGKELVAKAIVVNSDRREMPFVSINCGAIPEHLLESELFGHAKGSFTGAVGNHKGLIETANGGTLFLDEIGELPPSLQVKLLRFLQEGEIRRVGETEVRKFDVRIISATNRNLEEEIEKGNFRNDLFFRLGVIPIHIPPLRERKEDIPMLANHLFQRLCDRHGRNVSGISSRMIKILIRYNWPGNVRELENAIEYALHFTDDGQTIKAEDLPDKIRDSSITDKPFSVLLSLDEYGKQVTASLQDENSDQQIAEILGISRKTLWEKRKKWQLLR